MTDISTFLQKHRVSINQGQAKSLSLFVVLCLLLRCLQQMKMCHNPCHFCKNNEKGGGKVTDRILKVIIKVQIIISCLSGILSSFHLVFYPNVGGISISMDWTNIIFGFGSGLVSQYFLLHFLLNKKKTKGYL